MSQLKYLYKDLVRILGKNKWRILIIFFSRVFVGIFWYRIDRSLFLLIGKNYRLIRIFLSPLFYMVQAYSNIDIHYQSDIGPGLLVLHPSVGVVISGNTIIGKNATFTGGNVIGDSKKCNRGDFVIGDNCYLGANACIMGPVILGNNLNIGACACVVKSVQGDHLTLVGVPARPLNHANI